MYTQEQIDLFDKIFRIIYEYHVNHNRSINLNPDSLSEHLKCDKDDAEEAFNIVCEIGTELGLLKTYKSGYGNYEVMDLIKLKATYFIDSGGFLSYYNGLNNDKSSMKIILNLHQTIEIQFVFDLLEKELSKTQLQELKEILLSESISKREKLIEKISSFGLNVAASVLANLISKCL